MTSLQKELPGAAGGADRSAISVIPTPFAMTS